ncbi:hypothetical protein WICPIJ_009832 [Wickerhamomyces pijperi]|uniref:RWD domain-containing protein n=1 Tax=Wickerhamomyces pijperi TaxID=599730 RepID=A0A9P8PKT7_WICPI|nr:hypothetical protein WICPIJ_009832 [Wickerhamomyces pijperi]
MIAEEVQDELGAIEAIYPECFNKLNENLLDLKVPQHEDYTIRISFPDSYPASEPPHILQVRSSNKNDDETYLEALFNEVLDSVFKNGEVCVFDFLTELEGILYVEEDDISQQVQIETEPVVVDHLEGWTLSEPVTDRGSTFIAFAREVHSEDELFQKVQILKADRKIKRSSHNMLAYRIANPNGTRASDCDDDGETAAGSRMLHLLTLMGVENCVVVVSRWFGGTHIGPDRFKHINSTAREAVLKAGFGDASLTAHGKKEKKK